MRTCVPFDDFLRYSENTDLSPGSYFYAKYHSGSKRCKWIDVFKVKVRKLGPEVSRHCWSSGTMSVCHAGDSGSIPGQCTFFVCVHIGKKEVKKKIEETKRGCRTA